MLITKRATFRFICKQRCVVLRTEYEEGEGILTNISTGGCALESATISVSMGEQLLIAFAIEDYENPVEVKAEVVRVENNNLGLKFLIIETETENIIRKHFSSEYRTLEKQRRQTT